ncbi:hypothetical protein [Veillonella parvula]|uniref:hypothetical protein n=1 Tax=Veillonella parvula TaxID=29466 RepID=UPI0026605861|nr:hypothetical protein [Veillonella parvula]
MLTSKEIGEVVGFIEGIKRNYFITTTGEIVIEIEKNKSTYLFVVMDKKHRILLSIKDKGNQNSTIEIREFYKSQSECDYVENALRSLLWF